MNKREQRVTENLSIVREYADKYRLTLWESLDDWLGEGRISDFPHDNADWLVEALIENVQAIIDAETVKANAEREQDWASDI